ncbi:MAG: 23S rRNA (guanosine-2'-O-)-methyltransferase RlmB [Candidatus Anoxychlamydiales bacterium]|nr:23S rRNA (guanosine-2'-O-)-methyltransferase RlmB [Candidatus Anoxychlamydiales bacterium]
MKNVIMGRNTIKEVLKYKINIFIEVYTSAHENDFLVKELKKNNILIKFVSKKTLFSQVKSESHQGFVAKIKSRRFIEFKRLIEKLEDKDRSLVIMLDSIYDPQNLGAILRVCECFSVDSLMFSKNRGTDITPVVTKIANGASELLDICIVSNLASTIDQFKKEGYEVVSSILDEKAKKLNEFKFANKTLLILGSEGIGIQPLIVKKSDDLLYIPMSGRLQSLNVSQAASILIAAFNKTF